VAAQLLAPVRQAELPAVGTALRRGEPLAWLRVAGGAVPVTTPVDGHVAQVNAALLANPELVGADPYAAGWIVVVESTDQAAIAALLSAEAMRARMPTELRWFRRQIGLALWEANTAAQIGPTLNDGGELLADWRQMVGLERFQQILRDLVG
jgi:glycine cleavage system H protein